MLISPTSYSSYNNSINIRKNLKNNSQIPENQVAFKGLEKVATKTSQEAITKNSGKIFAMLAGILGITQIKIANKKAQKEEKALKAKTNKELPEESLEDTINNIEKTKEATAFAKAKQKAQEKFGIQVTEVFADSNPGKGDCHRVYYIHNGEAKICYLAAPPGGNTKSEVLEKLISKHNDIEEFPRTEFEGILNKEALKKYREERNSKVEPKEEPIVKKETKAKNSSSINDFIDEESYNSSSSTSTSKSSNQESSVLDDWFIWSMMQNND